MRGIELYSNSIIDSFLWENRKELILIKVGKKYEIYNIKDKYILLYISMEKNEKRCFNTQIFKNLYIANNLNVDTIKLLYNNYVFMLK